MMKNMIFKMLAISVMAGSVAFLGGCKSKPSADLYGSSDNLIGDPLIGDVPLGADNLNMPMDGDRSLFPPVFFAYDSSQVNPEEAGKCEQVASYLKKGKGQGVIVEGHADERGTREYNLALGERRAKAVANYLAIQGVPNSQIEVISYGEEKPAAIGQGDSVWAKNRRVELIYID